jgi:hypothetical protein
MYLNQVTSELPELHEDVMNIPCGEDYDPVLASVFDDLSGRMLLLPQDAGGSNNAGVMTYSHVPQLQEENQSHGFCTLEDKERDCEDGNIFLNLDAESDGEDDAVGTLSNSKSANSSLHSIPDEALLTATSTPLKSSTPVALALFELASFTKQDIFQSSPLTPSSATTSAATSACDITLGCQISGNMQQSYGVQRSYMHPNPPGNTHSSGGANISQMQFGPPTTTRTRPFVGVRGGDAATVQQAPESAPPRRYKIMQPSKFCHVCVRSGELVTLAPCANVTTGVCRKAICRKCFEKHGHVEEWDIACKNNALLAAEQAAPAGRGPISSKGCLPESAWTCLHCRNLCPDSAQCKIYARTNKRRHLMLKQRKVEKARSSGERAGAITNNGAMHHRMFAICGGIRRPARPHSGGQTASHVADLIANHVDHSIQYQHTPGAISSSLLSSMSSIPKHHY